MVAWQCVPRIIANDWSAEKYDAPSSAVTVCLPALIRSQSSWPLLGKGPTPSMPFSDCSVISTPLGR